MPRTPNAASSAVTARTSGTIAAMAAPNATSRMRNVSGIVSRSDASRPPLTSSWMSSLANVPSSEWIRRPGCATRVSSRKPRIDCESRVERRSVTGHRGRDPDGRSVWRDEAGLGRCEPRIDDLLERRRRRAIDVGRVGRHPREDVIDICGEGCVVQRSFRIADDEQRLVGRFLRRPTRRRGRRRAPPRRSTAPRYRRRPRPL